VIEEPATLIPDVFGYDCCFRNQLHHSSVRHLSSPPDVEDDVLLNPKGEAPGN
jgi:hypothetical protein